MDKLKSAFTSYEDVTNEQKRKLPELVEKSVEALNESKQSDDLQFDTGTLGDDEIKKLLQKLLTNLEI